MTDFRIVGNDGTPVAVDDEFRLQVHSTQQSDEQHSIDEGKTWNVSSGQITLTNDSATPIHYVKNTGTKDLIIPLYVLLNEASTGGSGVMAVEILRNPTGGTIVTDANAGTETNQNFGSNTPFPGLNYYGATGKTVTGHDTDNTMRSRTTADNRLLLGIITYLPQGASVAVQVTPPTGNTSMVIESVMEIYQAS